MATLVEGTYVIISAGSGLAVDVKGASDKSGTNIIQYTVNKGDAQIWAATKPENGDWQFINSLSGKCMDVAATTSGSNVRQYNDTDDKNKQRWKVVDTGGTYTYSGKSYNTFYIRPAGNTGVSLNVNGSSNSTGANIQIYTNNTSSQYFRWIFVPVAVFKSGYSYEIHLASDTSKVVGIASGSESNSARAIVQSDADSDSQMFYTDVDDETFGIIFHALHSDKVLDIRGGSAANSKPVIQYTKSGNSNQVWLAVQNGTVKYSGTNYPTYELRSQSNSNFVMDCQGASSAASTNIIVYTRSGAVNQRFFFVKTECFGRNIAAPGSLTPTLFKRNGAGSVTVSGLSFKSKGTKFQARYKVRTYTANRASYTDTAWKALDDDSTARNGWGDAWEPTFTATPVNGVVSLPFSKSFTLSSSARSIDIYIQVREYQNAYTLPINGTQIRAHGPATQTTIRVRQTPTVSLGSVRMTDSNGEVAISLPFSASGFNAEYIKARLVDANHIPVTEWVNDVGTFTAVIPLTKFKRWASCVDETLYVEYSILTDEGALVSGYLQCTGAGHSAAGSTTLTTASVANDECVTLTASSIGTYTRGNWCFMEIDDLDKSRLVEVTDVSGSTSTTKSWRVAPPLNKDVKLIKIGSYLASGATTPTYIYETKTVRVESHLFIWNWSEQSNNVPIFKSAAILVNPDAPPQQTRQFTSSLKATLTAGRTYPVGFSPHGITASMDVEGIAIDRDADYDAAGPIPTNIFVENLGELATLSGSGIHPIYRTPYGDWYVVGISGVDLSKTNMNYSKASVTQTVLEE